MSYSLTQEQVDRLILLLDKCSMNNQEINNILAKAIYHNKPENQKQEYTKPQKKVETKVRGPETSETPKLDVGEYMEKVTGIMLDDPVQRDVETRYGQTRVTSFKLQSKSIGIVKTSLWGKLADEALGYSKGSRIQLTNMRIQEPFDGVNQISSCRKTELRRAT